MIERRDQLYMMDTFSIDHLLHTLSICPVLQLLSFLNTLRLTAPTMVLKIHGNPMSTCTNRVQTVCEELGITYELFVADFAKGDHKAPAFLAVQPFGQVPYIDDDGFKLFESRAICRYLTLTHSGVGKLMPDPSDVKKTVLFEHALCVELANFDPLASGVALELVYKP